MTSETALITGASGLLGRQVVAAFQRIGWNTIGTGFTRVNPPSIVKLDLNDAEAVEETLDKSKPQVVVHCAAQRQPDKVEADPDASIRLNTQATGALAKAVASRDSSTNPCVMIYISTDYVFSGQPGEAPYPATAKTNPTNLYGRTKRDGEWAVAEATASGVGVSLRVPVLYGPTSSNDAVGRKESAINTLFDAVWKAQEHEVVMDDWSLRYPTSTEDVGRVCADIASTYLARREQGKQEDLPRILQFTSEDRMTKYEICKALAEEVLGLPLEKKKDGTGRMVANKQGNDPKAAVQRPFDTHLSTQELQDLNIDISTRSFINWWRWQMRAYKK
ncbi:MAG: hypothetical protein M1831_001350 [Alyxoria varia]|nr:MAG: hypothetical protein M1831_001350 [Alyxoria varia]